MAYTREELEMLRDRAGRAGLGVTHEGETTCCYARSEKSWVTDRQGIEWEMFYTPGAADEAPTAARIPSAAAAGTGCCEPGCCEGEPASPLRAGRVA